MNTPGQSAFQRGPDERGETLTFRWQERGGPPVALPKRTDFGTSLPKAALGEGRLD
jgi:two-component sensor histidine kinase